jgi:hypothetical protein
MARSEKQTFDTSTSLPMTNGAPQRFVRLATVAFGALALMAPAWAERTCALKKPPRAAGVNASHGNYFFVFPRKVRAGYTGCQTMWNEMGERVLVIRFQRGSPLTYEEHACPRNGATLTCDFRRGAVHASDCPAYEDLQDGLRTIPAEQELQVRPSNDPRKS